MPPKRKSPGRKSDYIQFRPYHAFTTAAPEPRSGVAWKIGVVFFAILGLGGALYFILPRLH